MRRLPGSPMSRGYVARMMGTAPRRPTQGTEAISRGEKRKKGSRPATATGRATRIRTADTARPAGATSTSRLGNARSPSIVNITIWASHAIPSLKRKMPRLHAARRTSRTPTVRKTAMGSLEPLSTSRRETSRIQAAAIPVVTAVTRTPAVARVTAGFHATRRASREVRRPPSKSATVPKPWARP